MLPTTTTTLLQQEVWGYSLGTVLAPAVAAETTDTLLLALDRAIATIDALVAAQLDAILHHERVRRLEGSWRGLAWLVRGLDPGGPIRVRVLSLTWRDLCRDLARMRRNLTAASYSGRFTKTNSVCQVVNPSGCWWWITRFAIVPPPPRPTDDVSTLTALAGVAAAAFAPVVLAASPSLLQVDDFGDLALAGELADPFRSEEFARWRGLGRQEDTRFVAVALPRALARAPWADDRRACRWISLRRVGFGAEATAYGCRLDFRFACRCRTGFHQPCLAGGHLWRRNESAWWWGGHSPGIRTVSNDTVLVSAQA